MEEIKDGAKWRDIQPEDDKAGAQSRVVFEIRQPDGQHDAFVPQDNETQFNRNGDWSTCTNNGCSNSCDTQVNKLIAMNKVSPEKIAKLEKYGFLIKGRHNSSERWNAILSGTDSGSGNYLYKPWDSARHDGMIPEKLLPYDPNCSKSDYFKFTRTAEMDEAAKVWKDIFNVQYEVIPTDVAQLQYHLQQAPITVMSGVCRPWGAVVPVCSLDRGHATMLYGWKENEYLKDFDSYIPNCKKLSWGYKISYAIKGVVTVRDELLELKHFFNTEMRLGDTNEEVKTLQIALFLDGSFYDSEWKTREHIQKWGGYFGESTQRNVKAFQKKYGLQETGIIGMMTLKKLNLLFDL